MTPKQIETQIELEALYRAISSYKDCYLLYVAGRYLLITHKQFREIARRADDRAPITYLRITYDDYDAIVREGLAKAGDCTNSENVKTFKSFLDFKKEQLKTADKKYLTFRKKLCQRLGTESNLKVLEQACQTYKDVYFVLIGVQHKLLSEEVFREVARRSQV